MARRNIHIHLHGAHDRGHRLLSTTGRDEKIGFQKLENSLAQRKNPPDDPAAVAAVAGREKYGAAGMAKKAAAGRK